MRKLLHILFFSFALLKISIAQTPDYYYYLPANAGVNNLYFNTVTSYKFLFIITESEWAAAGVTGQVMINSIWFKSNTAYSLSINDLVITMGHSTLVAPSPVFADNFDAGLPVEVLNEPLFNYSMTGAAWNDPPAGWSEIVLTTPFLYNGSDNLVIQAEYSNINYPIPLYADNGGIAVSQLSAVYGAATADYTTARPMFGISGSISPLAFTASDSSVCEKFCVDYTDFSSNNPTSWLWMFEGGDPPTSTKQNPANICYSNPGIFDVTLITESATGSDTLTLPDFITVNPTPPFPTITQTGSTLTSSAAANYQWQFNSIDISGATNQSYDVSQSGYYTVLINDSNGCSSAASVNVLLEGTSAITKEGGLLIYPNPSNGTFFIEWLKRPEPMNDITIEIFNAFGQRIYSSNEKNFIYYSQNDEINLGDATTGIYFIEIKNKDFSVRKKLIISD